MNPCRMLLWTLALYGVAGGAARAHFLFIRIGPPGEAGRAAEVYFSELAEAGDPRFIDRIAHTQLWLQDTPGRFRPLKVHKAADRLRAFLPAQGTVAVSGVCEYGVLVRNKVPFLLRHYPRAVAGNPDEVNRLLPREGTPLEITATFESDRIRFVVSRDGQPAPGALLETVAADLANEQLTADARGQATWKPKPGRYAVYTSHVRKQAGAAGGQRYEEVREFATLAFTWPLEVAAADPAAVELFRAAVAARASWKDFPGFAAAAVGKLDGRPFTATVAIDAAGKVKVETEEDVVEPWLREQLESIVRHRLAGPQMEAASVLRFADAEEDHPLGRLLLFAGGRFASSYRVKDRVLTVSNRHLGKQNMTLTVLENERNREGRLLPRCSTVQYWDAAEGTLLRTETVQQRWQRVGSWDLPTTHTVTTAGPSGLAVRSFTLSGHRLTEKP